MFKMMKRFWNWGWSIYHKNEELWNYLITGGLGTVISIISYAVLRYLNLGIIESNIISWIIVVISMYILNKIFVFKTKCKSKIELLHEFISFILARLFTLVVETAILYVGSKWMKINDIIIKVFAQIVIIILNYVLSKLIIFKKNEK